MQKKKTDSVIISWDYSGSGEGFVLVGEKDPLGIEQRIHILDVLSGDSGLSALHGLGIELTE